MSTSKALQLLAATALSDEPLADIAPRYGYPTAPEAAIALAEARDALTWEVAPHEANEHSTLGAAIAAYLPPSATPEHNDGRMLHVHYQRDIDEDGNAITTASATWQQNMTINARSLGLENTIAGPRADHQIGAALIGSTTVDDIPAATVAWRRALDAATKEHARALVDNALTATEVTAISEADEALLNGALGDHAATVALATIASRVREVIADDNADIRKIMDWVRELQADLYYPIADADIMTMIGMR